MHVGFVSLESPFDVAKGGGIASYLRAMIPALVQAGHRVTLITNAEKTGTRTMDRGSLRVVSIRLPSLHWYFAKLPLGSATVALPMRQVEWSLGFRAAARRALEEDPVDVLESPEVGALLLAHCPIAPLIIRLHGSDYTFRRHTGEPMHPGALWDRLLERAALRRARAVTSPSHSQAAEVSNEMGWARGRIIVIPNPIAPQMLAEARRAQHSGNGNPPTVLYTGRLRLAKGTPALLESARTLQESFPHVCVLLAGPWQLPGSPRRWGLEPNGEVARGVVWLGHVPWAKLKDIYRRSTVFVMPSYYEPFGISCLEAMAFGLPVVATKTGGLPEVVADGVTGILVPPRDPQALADAMVRLLRDPNLRRRMGEAGKERVLAEFSGDAIVTKAIDVYRAVQRGAVG